MLSIGGELAADGTQLAAGWPHREGLGQRSSNV